MPIDATWADHNEIEKLVIAFLLSSLSGIITITIIDESGGIWSDGKTLTKPLYARLSGAKKAISIFAIILVSPAITYASFAFLALFLNAIEHLVRFMSSTLQWQFSENEISFISAGYIFGIYSGAMIARKSYRNSLIEKTLLQHLSKDTKIP